MSGLPFSSVMTRNGKPGSSTAPRARAQSGTAGGIGVCIGFSVLLAHSDALNHERFLRNGFHLWVFEELLKVFARTAPRSREHHQNVLVLHLGLGFSMREEGVGGIWRCRHGRGEFACVRCIHETHRDDGESHIYHTLATGGFPTALRRRPRSGAFYSGRSDIQGWKRESQSGICDDGLFGWLFDCEFIWWPHFLSGCRWRLLSAMDFLSLETDFFQFKILTST